MENLELQFPQGFNIEAFERHGTLLGNLQLSDFHSLKQEPFNYQEYLSLERDNDYPSKFSMLDQQIYVETNYPEENLSKSTASSIQSSQEFEKLPQQEIEKLMLKARRQMYRERAKQRKLQKDAMKDEISLQIKEEMPIQVKLEESIQCQQFPMDPKEQRKQQQQLRNRISAQESRDKRKKYVSQLELKQEQLESKIKLLELENKQLKGGKNNNGIKQQCFTQETAKIGFIVFNLMALMCSNQTKKYEKDEQNVQNEKEIININDQEKQSNKEIVLEEDLTIGDNQKLGFKQSDDKIKGKSTKKDKLVKKTIRKQRKKGKNCKK